NQQSLVGMFGEGPAVKVLRGIRQEFDRTAQASALPKPEQQGNTAAAAVEPVTKPAVTGTRKTSSSPAVTLSPLHGACDQGIYEPISARLESRACTAETSGLSCAFIDFHSLANNPGRVQTCRL